MNPRWDDDRVSDAARSRLLSHGEVRPRAFLLLHGLTASPPQFQQYADALYARGHNVLVPRLPLHGHRDRLTKALAALTDEELRAFAREQLDAVRALGRAVTVAGFSAGATLVLWLAQRERFDRAVAIAPFLGAAMIPRPVMDVAAAAMLRLRNRFVWWDPVRRERQMPEHGYPRWPTHAVARFYRLANEVRRDAALPPKTSEICIVTNRGEASVNNGEIRALARRLSAVGARVERIELRRMPPSHDIIEPLRTSPLAQRVFPAILAAIDPEGNDADA